MSHVIGIHTQHSEWGTSSPRDKDVYSIEGGTMKAYRMAYGVIGGFRTNDCTCHFRMIDGRFSISNCSTGDRELCGYYEQDVVRGVERMK